MKTIRNVNHPTATYVEEKYYSHIKNRDNIKIIIEAGSRDLRDALELEKIYPSATILSFECNPECVDVCKHNLQYSQGRIKFYDVALANHEGTVDFYCSATDEPNSQDPGISSLYQHNDISNTPMHKITVKARKLINILKENNLDRADLLCLDLQGGECNAILGLEHFINSVKYIITEFDGEHYLNAPTGAELSAMLKNHNFDIIFSESDTIFKNNKIQ